MLQGTWNSAASKALGELLAGLPKQCHRSRAWLGARLVAFDSSPHRRQRPAGGLYRP
jgi:hypothetical protein